MKIGEAFTSAAPSAVTSRIKSVFLCLAVALLASCGRESPEVIARVQGIPISRSEFEEALSKRAQTAGPNFDEAALREEVLEELIRAKAMLARAKAAGYDQDPELQRQFDRMIVEKFSAARKTNAIPEPFAKEIEQYYHSHRAEFMEPEKVRIALIRLDGSTKATPEKQRELLERANDLLAKARSLPPEETTFGDLARQHSDDLPTRYTGGDCGWVTPSLRTLDWPPEVRRAIAALEKQGEFSPPIKANGDIYLLRLIDRKPAAPVALEQVKERIAYTLAQQRHEESEREFEEEQRAGLKIKVNQAALSRVRVPTNPPAHELAGKARPPGIPAN